MFKNGYTSCLWNITWDFRLPFQERITNKRITNKSFYGKEEYTYWDLDLFIEKRIAHTDFSSVIEAFSCFVLQYILLAEIRKNPVQSEWKQI